MVHPRDTAWSWLYHGTTASASCLFYWAIVTCLRLVTWLEYTRFVNLCKGDEIEEMIACDRDVCRIKCFYMDCLRITKILTASCIECLLLVLKHFWSACAWAHTKFRCLYLRLIKSLSACPKPGKCNCLQLWGRDTTCLLLNQSFDSDWSCVLISICLTCFCHLIAFKNLLFISRKYIFVGKIKINWRL